MAMVLFIPSVVCGFMAYWQYQRMEWKDSLIKLRGAMLEADARSIFSEGEIQEYEKVTVSGVFLHDKTIFVGPRPRSIPGAGIQSGYLLVTPLYDAARKGTVMVNRGWVPRSWEGDIEALRKTSPDVASITGVVQPSEKPSAVVPDNVPDKLEFHWFDVPALARSCGLPPDTPLIQVVSDSPSTAQQMRRESPMEATRNRPLQDGYSPPQFPIPKNTSDLVKFATMPTDHMMYAATWAALCVTLGFMARQAVFFPSKRRRIIGDSRQAWKSVATRE